MEEEIKQPYEDWIKGQIKITELELKVANQELVEMGSNIKCGLLEIHKKEKEIANLQEKLKNYKYCLEMYQKSIDYQVREILSKNDTLSMWDLKHSDDVEEFNSNYLIKEQIKENEFTTLKLWIKEK